MLQCVLDWFKKDSSEQTTDSNSPQRAAAALLLEVAYSDEEFSEQERKALPALLSKHTNLTTQECLEVISIAEQDVDTATSLHQFTHYLNEKFNLQEKINLVITLWLVALSDDKIDKYEDHMIRKIADLLHLRHSEFMQCKFKAVEQHG
ncbi:hypothetical protein A9Q73_09710 [Bermanella sp. 47_1433_sub80_T6]|nr:hypothetical protein A9Q73_09710 [Bermanella sp. 47_1433_sub80_T6]